MKYIWTNGTVEHDTCCCDACNGGSNNILQASKKYKQIMRNVLKQHIKKKKGPVAFSILCQIKLVKYNNKEEDLESTDVYYHSTTKRVIFNMEKLLTSDGIEKVYHKGM